MNLAQFLGTPALHDRKRPAQLACALGTPLAPRHREQSCAAVDGEGKRRTVDGVRRRIEVRAPQSSSLDILLTLGVKSVCAEPLLRTGSSALAAFIDVPYVTIVQG